MGHTQQRATTLKRAGLWLFLVLALLTPILYTRVGGGRRVYAAASNNLNFQARLLTGSGAIVPDGNYSIQFNLYNVASGGTTQWTETQATVAVRAGYVSVYLGSVTAFPGTIDWSQQQWLTMNVNGDGEMTPRLKLTAVPNALHANEADALRSGSNLLTADNFAQLTPSTPQVINSALAALRLNQTGAGLLAQLQHNGSDVFTIANSGNLISSGSGTFSGGTLNLGSATQQGGLVLYDGAGKTGTLKTTSLGANRNYTLPDADGVVCLTTTCPGAAGGFGNGGNSFGAAAILGTNDNFSLSFRTNNTNQLTLDTSGNLNFLNGGLQIGGTTVLTSLKVLQNVTANTSILTSGILGNARGGTGLDTSAAANGQLLIGNGSGFSLGTLANNGGLTITNSAGGIGLAVNYGSTSTSAVRGDTTLICPSGSGNLTGGGNTITLGSGGTCGALSTNNAVSFSTSVTTPLITNNGALSILTADSTSANTGNITLKSGNASSGSNLNAGTILIDTGTKTGSGTAIINFGTSNALAINIGNSNSALSLVGTSLSLGSGLSTISRTAAGTTTFDLVDGSDTTLALANSGAGKLNLTVDGTLQIGTLASATTTRLCLNGSVVAACSTSGSGVAFVNGGNSFGGLASLGTTDSNDLAFITGTGGTERWRITTTGLLQSNGAQTIQTSTGNLTLATGGGNGNILLNPNGTGKVGIGLSGAPSALLSVGGTTGTLTVDGSGNIATSGTYNTNTFTGTQLIFGGASGSVSTTGNGNLTIGPAGSGVLALNTGTGGTATTNISTLQRNGATGMTIDLNNAGTTALTITNSDASNVASLSVEGGITAGTNNAFSVNTDGDITGVARQLDGSSTANGGSIGASTSLTLNSAANFDVGNYVRVTSNNCGGTGINPCYAKITAKATNTLTIAPALTWTNNSAVVEFHFPEIGGVDTSQTLLNRYGRGYFISGVATGNGTTYYNEDSITTSLSSFDLLNTGVTTLNIGGAATTLNIGNSGTTVNVLGNLQTAASQTITAGGGLTVSSGGASITGNTSVSSGTFSASGGLISLNASSNNGTNINTGSSAGTITLGGGSSPLVIDSTNFDVSSSGALSGITTINASGAITAATSSNTINGLVINSGVLSSVTGITFTSGSLNLNSGGLTNGGAFSGITTLGLSGAISGATSGNTINGLIINSGSLSSITGITFTSGSLNLNSGGLTNGGAFSGITTLGLSGAISGATSGNTINGLIINSGALSGITGLTTTSGGASITGNTTIATSSNSANAFQVQNSSGTNILRVDTAGNLTNNLITNASVESAISGNWVAKGAATVSQDATDYYYGSNSLKIVTTAATGDGAKQNVTLASNTAYTFSVYARSSAGNMSTFELGYSDNGSTDTSCLTGQFVSKSGWTRLTCAFTTGTVAGTTYIYARQTDATARTAINIDAAILQTEANSTPAYHEGQIALQGSITTPLTIQNTSNSTTALQVLSSKGANIFSVDSSDNNILAGNAGFEVNSTGWAYSGTGGSLARNGTQSYTGNFSIKVITTANANNGAKFTLSSGNPAVPALLTSTQYTLSFYARLDAASAALTDITMAYARDGSTEVNCNPSDQVVVSGGWKRYSCAFSTDGTTPAANAYLVIKQVGAAVHTFYIDSVQLELGGTPTSYGAGGISLNASFTSPVSIKNTADSVSSFQVQDAVGTNFLSVDTLNDKVTVGSPTTDANQVLLQLDSYSVYADTATCSATNNQGAIYYNTVSNSVRGCLNGVWEDVVSTNGLGLLLYGVVPDSGSGNGDIAASSGATNGPCRVSWTTATTVKIVQGCTAYSGGRKVIIPDNTTPSGSLTFTAGNTIHVCLNGTNNQPAFSASGAETANMPTWSANNPILCLADIKTSAAAITNIYDVRTFSTSTKTFVTAPAAVGLGWIVVHHATNINAVTTSTTALNDTNTTNLTVRGVIAAYSGSVSTTTPNAILITAGPQWVKATGTSSINGYVGPSGTAGYSGTYASASPFASSNFGSVLGVSSRTIDTACNATTNCQYSQFVNPISVR